jgi:hypothetical protein
MSFRQFGGLNYSSKNNIVTNQFQSSNNSNATVSIGGLNSKIISCSHIDMSNNSFMHVGKIYFADGTFQATAANSREINRPSYASVFSNYTNLSDVDNDIYSTPQFGGGTKNSIPYQTDVNKTSYLDISGTENSVLSYNYAGLSGR